MRGNNKTNKPLINKNASRFFDGIETEEETNARLQRKSMLQADEKKRLKEELRQTKRAIQHSVEKLKKLLGL